MEKPTRSRAKKEEVKRVSGEVELAKETFTVEDAQNILTESEKRLGPKRLKFVREYMASGGSIEKAAEAAEYPLEMASKMLVTDGLVKQALAERSQIADLIKSIDRDFVLSKLAFIAAHCSKLVPEYDRRGNVIGMKIADAGTAHRVLKDIGVEIGMWNNKVEIGGTGEPIQIERKDISVDITAIASKIGALVAKQHNPDGDDNEQV